MPLPSDLPRFTHSSSSCNMHDDPDNTFEDSDKHGNSKMPDSLVDETTRWAIIPGFGIGCLWCTVGPAFAQGLE